MHIKIKASNYFKNFQNAISRTTCKVKFIKIQVQLIMQHHLGIHHHQLNKHITKHHIRTFTSWCYKFSPCNTKTQFKTQMPITNTKTNLNLRQNIRKIRKEILIKLLVWRHGRACNFCLKPKWNSHMQYKILAQNQRPKIMFQSKAKIHKIIIVIIIINNQESLLENGRGLLV